MAKPSQIAKRRCLAGLLFSPWGMSVSTSLTYAMLVHPDSEPQIALHWTGSEHATWHTEG